MRNSRIEACPTSGALGAGILGVDLSRGLDGSDVEELRAAFNEYGVIYFRNQTISPEQHIAFAEHFEHADVLHHARRNSARVATRAIDE